MVAASGKLDKPGIATLLDHIIASEADGMLILGSGGEFSYRTPAMRYQVAEFCISYVDQRLPVIVGISSSSTKEAILYDQHEGRSAWMPC